MRRLLVVALVVCACGFDPQNLPAMRFDTDVSDVWRDGAPTFTPASSGERRLLVTNNLDDTVSVVSWDKLKVDDATAELARFPVGLVPFEREGPHHVSVDASGTFAYVGISNFVPGGGSGPHGVHGGGTAEGRVLKVDLVTLRTVAAQRVDRNPGDVRLSPDGSVLVMSHFDLVKIQEAQSQGIVRGPELDARLALLDPITLARRQMVPTCPAPHGVSFTPDGTKIVASCLSDEAAVVDVAKALVGDDDAVLRTVLIDEPGTGAAPSCGPYASTMSASGQTAWISCYSSGELVAVDTTSAARGQSLALPGLAVFGDVSDAGDLLAIATQDTDGIMVFDIGADDTLTTRAFFPMPQNRCVLPHAVVFLDDDSTLALVCEGNKRDAGTIAAVDVANGVVLGAVAVGLFPDDIAVQVMP